MNITPNSTLYLLSNVPLDPNYNYTLDFDSLANQEQFFDEKISSSFDINEGYSYIRDTQVLKVQANVDSLFGVNYLFYNNGNKRYYAFITKKDYVNPNCTAITFKIDVLQSFMFDYEIDESFIEREHQNRWTEDGKPIFNTKLENLEIGSNYIVTKSQKLVDDNHIWYYVYAKEPLGDEYYTTGGSPIDKSLLHTSFITEVDPTDVTNTQTINSGYYMYVFSEGSVINGVLPPDSSRPAYSMIAFNSIVEDTRVVKIVATRYIPKGITYNKEDNSYTFTQGTSGLSLRACRYDKIPTTQLLFEFLLKVEEISNYDFAKDYEIEDTITKPTLSISNPKNIASESKLYTSPYSMFRVNLFNNFTNLARENFSNTKKLRIAQGIVNQTNLFVQPLNYLGEENGNFSIITAQIDGQVNLRTDAWDTYQANNSASINGGLAVKVAGAVGAVALGIATGGVGLAVLGATALALGGQIANEMQKRQDIKNTPDEIKQAPNDSYTPVLLNKMAVIVDTIDLKEEYKTAVFNYFFRYGYKCNDFKKPSLKSRYYFNYIKTLGANVKSNIDAEVKTEIAQIYDNGLTIWHYRNKSTFKGVNNYDYENVEMTLMEE